MNENAQTPQKTEDREDDRTRWPWPAQFLLVVIALATAVVLLIWIPMHVAPSFVEGSSRGTAPDFSMMMAVFVGLTAMTVSGIFLFMTFRIDRGTKTTARRVAQKAGEAKAEEVAKNELGKLVNERLTKMWGDYVIEDIRKKKQALNERIEGMNKGLDTQVSELEKHECRADRIVSNLEKTGKDARIRMEEIKEQAESELKRMGEDGRRALEAIGEQAGKAIKEASERVVKSVEEAEGGAVKSVEEAGKAAADAARRAGENVRDGIRNTEREERNQVEKAGADARERIEREMTDIAEDARKRLDHQVKQVADEARTKIAEANVEHLLDEKVEPYLQGLTARRGLFGSRPREPRS